MFSFPGSYLSYEQADQLPRSLLTLTFCDSLLANCFTILGYSEVNLHAGIYRHEFPSIPLDGLRPYLHRRPHISISRAWGTNSSSPTPPGPAPALALTPAGCKLNIGQKGRIWVLVKINCDSVSSRTVSRNSLLWSFLFFIKIFQVSIQILYPSPPSSYQSVRVVGAGRIRSWQNRLASHRSWESFVYMAGAQ